MYEQINSECKHNVTQINNMQINANTMQQHVEHANKC